MDRVVNSFELSSLFVFLFDKVSKDWILGKRLTVVLSSVDYVEGFLYVLGKVVDDPAYCVVRGLF